MDAKCNTPKVLCLGLLLIAVVAAVISLVVGCETLSREATRREIAAALQVAYDAGGKVAVSNRIEQLVAEGRLKPENAAILHVLAERAFDDVVNALAPANAAALAVGNAEVQSGDGCGVNGDELSGSDLMASAADAGIGAGGDGPGAAAAESVNDHCGKCVDVDGGEDDAYCGECGTCKTADAE